MRTTIEIDDEHRVKRALELYGALSDEGTEELEERARALRRSWR